MSSLYQFATFLYPYRQRLLLAALAGFALNIVAIIFFLPTVFIFSPLLFHIPWFLWLAANQRPTFLSIFWLFCAATITIWWPVSAYQVLGA